jgi:hypothetical protein
MTWHELMKIKVNDYWSYMTHVLYDSDTTTNEKHQEWHSVIVQSWWVKAVGLASLQNYMFFNFVE